jgi:flagellar biosynthesis regulator FlaF
VTLANLVRAYAATRAALDPREQEADVFRRVTGGLRAAQQQDGPSRVRAVADNRRLWLAVESALADPANQLPAAMRAALISLGRAVQREMDQGAPDLAFLIEINDQVAGGLVGRG